MQRQTLLGILLFGLGLFALGSVLFYTAPAQAAPQAAMELDRELIAILNTAGFTGRIESTLEARLGRRINPQLAEIGPFCGSTPSRDSTMITPAPAAIHRPPGSVIHSRSPSASTITASSVRTAPGPATCAVRRW